MSTSWRVTWVASWGSLSKERTDAIEVYLADKMGGLSEGELNELIESMAMSDTSGRAPTMAQMITFMRDMRKRKRGIDTSEPYEVTLIRRKILNTPFDSLDRWDAICEATMATGTYNSDWGYRMEDFARKNGGFIIPWWAPREKHPMAYKQLPKPKGIRGWMDAVNQATHERMAAYA